VPTAKSRETGLPVNGIRGLPVTGIRTSQDWGFCSQIERYLRAVSAGSTPTSENMLGMYNDKLKRHFVRFCGTLWR
jgi:hypothetical protein